MFFCQYAIFEIAVPFHIYKRSRNGKYCVLDFEDDGKVRVRTKFW